MPDTEQLTERKRYWLKHIQACEANQQSLKVRISQQSCHRLHGKAATHFTRKLPPITRQSCHP